MHKLVTSDGQLAMGLHKMNHQIELFDLASGKTLWRVDCAKAGTPEYNERLGLVDLVVPYEEEHGIELWPVDHPVQSEATVHGLAGVSGFGNQ